MYIPIEKKKMNGRIMRNNQETKGIFKKINRYILWGFLDELLLKELFLKKLKIYRGGKFFMGRKEKINPFYNQINKFSKFLDFSKFSFEEIKRGNLIEGIISKMIFSLREGRYFLNKKYGFCSFFNLSNPKKGFKKLKNKKKILENNFFFETFFKNLI